MPRGSDTAELELPGGDESGTAELELPSENENDTAELEMPSETEGVRAEPEHTQPAPHDQIPILHQSRTQGSEELKIYPNNYGWPNGLAGGDLRYYGPIGTGGTTLHNMGLCPRFKKLAKVRTLISTKTPQPPPIMLLS